MKGYFPLGIENIDGGSWVWVGTRTYLNRPFPTDAPTNKVAFPAIKYPCSGLLTVLHR